VVEVEWPKTAHDRAPSHEVEWLKTKVLQVDYHRMERLRVDKKIFEAPQSL
jgi:hypothetical protein